MKSTPAPLWPTFRSKLIGNLLYFLSSARLCDGSIVSRVRIDSPRPVNFVVLINILLVLFVIRPCARTVMWAIERAHSVVAVAAKTSHENAVVAGLRLAE